MSPKLNAAVVGCGIGKNHMLAFQKVPEQFNLAALCEVDAQKGEAVAQELKIPKAYQSLDALCADPEIDVIDLATPPHLHLAQIRQVLAAGKHVICEKPLVSSLEHVDALVEVERASGKRILPIFQYRYGHGFQKLKFLRDRGLTGKAYTVNIETSWRRRDEYYAIAWRGKWATELGGCCLTHAIHAHDMLTYINGPVQRVFARCKTRVNPVEVEDCAAITFELADGSLAGSTITLGRADEISRHSFVFEKLTAESNTRPYDSSGDPWKFAADTPALQTEIDAALTEFKPEPEHYQGQFLRFHQALQTGGEIPATLADARQALELITAIYHSAETGKPEELPITSAHPKYRCWAPVSGRF
ncbi:MAG TPA: Gfo/Idh/MocA family oxidoreductase [Chthoniobacteraceae bacterium]|jgi:predicted dehydrogenase|nr:Gfo/Idh/MocA family oxidoreductase [Chthoniobacteraceae bacterium]